MTRTERVAIDANGNAIVTAKIHSTGLLFERLFQLKYMKQADKDNMNRKRFSYADYTVTNYSYSQPNRDSAILNEHIQLESKSVLQQVGNQKFISLAPLWLLDRFVQNHPIYGYCRVRDGEIVLDTTYYKLPAGALASQIPSEKAYKSDFGMFHTRYLIDGSTVVEITELKVNRGNYTGKKYEDFKVFKEQLEGLYKVFAVVGG